MDVAWLPGWSLFVATAVGLIGGAVAWAVLPLMWSRRVAWFGLLPSGGPVLWNEFRHVAAHTRRRVRNGMVLIMRVGSEAGGSDVWVGISGSRHPERTAQSMARAAGAHLGERTDLVLPDIAGWRWRLGCTETAPSRGERDATEAYLRAMDERTIPERASFPDVCADHMTSGDVFVAMCRPVAAPTRMQAACATTASGLDLSFTECAELRRRLLWPGLVGVAAAVGAATASMSAVLHSGDVWRLVVSIGVAVCGVWVVGRRVRHPGLVAALQTGRQPRLPRLARRGKQLPVWQIGEWAASDARGGTSAPMRPAPPQALGREGAVIGVDSSGQECRLPDGLRYRGTMAYGDPGVREDHVFVAASRA